MSLNTRISRRTLLGGAAAAGLGGISLATSYRAYDQGVIAAGLGSAFSTWDDWSEGPATAQMVKAAILAANPHNTQPWRFAIADNSIEVYADMERSTGANDPLDRELYVGLGAAIENLVVTGEALGQRADVSYTPEMGRSSPVATIQLTAAAPNTSRLYEAIPRRHSNRGPYSRKRLNPHDLDAASALADSDGADVGLAWITDDSKRQEVGDGIVRATEAFIADEEQSVEAFKWFRSDWDDIQRYKDGLNVDGAGLSPLITSLGKLLPAQSRESNDKTWVKQTRDTQVKTAAAFGVVTVRDAQSRVQQLRGGRLLQRMHLWATSSGIALQHMNQMTERADRERQLGLKPVFGDYLANLLAPSAHQALAVFRVGYAERSAKRSPRRPLSEVQL